jgi:predicted transcriptional regulator
MPTPMKDDPIQEHTTIRIDKALRDQVRTFAREQHRTFTDVVEEALRAYLKSPARFLGRPE